MEFSLNCMWTAIVDCSSILQVYPAFEHRDLVMNGYRKPSPGCFVRYNVGIGEILLE